MKQQLICFVGAGNMATSLIGGMIANGYAADCITACDLDPSRLKQLAHDYGINTNSDSLVAAQTADIVILAVKPQVMQPVCEQLAPLARRAQRLFISIAAGIREPAINRWLGGKHAVVRCMPNTPALIQLGATGLYANRFTDNAQRGDAEAILNAVGITVWVDQESALDAVTAVSGSGPAYFFYFIELLQQAGEDLGLPPETASLLARQTALGAASMAQSGDIAELRARVTSKKGTTEQAILSFQANHLDRLVEQATRAAYLRSQQLASELENS